VRWLTLRPASLVCLAIVGCAHAPRASAPSSAPVPAETRALVDDVQRLRGLSATAPIPIEVLDSVAFLKALRDRTSIEQHGAIQRDRALLIAFGFAGADYDLHGQLRELIDEQVVGFYDPRSKRLYVKAGGSTGMATVILAHEVEHALQDQHFHLPDLTQLTDDDQKIAAAAVREGDATVVMLLYGSRAAGKPPREVLVRASRTLTNLPPDRLLQATGQSPKLAQAPAILRDSMIFPYLGGLQFLGEIYRAGGFPLLDRVFTHLPRSTEQVLHPDKYLDGEPPIPVREPSVLLFHQRVTGGKLGELGIRSLLSLCLPFAKAAEAASDWGGDAYTILEAPDGKLALLWRTEWDSEEAAMRFERALRAQEQCWPAPTSGAPPASGWSIANTASVARKGARVSFVRGLRDAECKLYSWALLNEPVVATPVNEPPLGAVTLAPPELLPEERPEMRGTVVAGRYTSPRLGVSADIPQGFAGLVDQPDFDLVLKSTAAPTAHATALFRFHPDRLTPKLEEEIFVSFVQSLAQRGTTPTLESSGQGRIAFGEGHERSWSFPGTQMHIRASLLPMCDGRATALFFQIWDSPPGMQAVDAWLQSFARLGADPPPACAGLK